MEVVDVATVIIQIVKIILNLIILILYRIGYDGDFLGVGGTWNLNEEKNTNTEIIAASVFGGFFIYTIAVLISYAFGKQDKSLVNIIMNFFGFVFHVAVAGICLHYWLGYTPEHKFRYDTSEKGFGITLGILALISGLVYAIDTGLSFIHFIRNLSDDK